MIINEIVLDCLKETTEQTLSEILRKDSMTFAVSEIKKLYDLYKSQGLYE